MEGPDMSHGEDHKADSLICAHAFSGDRPVLYVYREADGFWNFTCGGTDHDNREDVLPVCHGCALEENELAEALEGLQPGYEASRDSVEHAWRFERNDLEAGN
ncbi:MAG: hypothetical protein HKP40_10315 [Litoreibacter sp.]|nr:hypothetical protein [Litoreibacter sp.]